MRWKPPGLTAGHTKGSMSPRETSFRCQRKWNRTQDFKLPNFRFFPAGVVFSFFSTFDNIQYTVTRKTYFKIKPHVYWKQHDGRPDLMWFVDSELMNMSVVVNGWGSDRRISKRDDHHYWGFYIVTNGTRAERCQQLEAEGHDVPKMMLAELIRLRPCFKDAIEIAGWWDWGKDHECIEGAFHYYPISTKVPAYYDSVSKPSNGR